MSSTTAGKEEATASLWTRLHKQAVKPVTWLWCQLEKHVGFSNLVYLLCLGLLSLVGGYDVFLCGTSFFHYFVYMATYSHAKQGCKAGGVAFGKCAGDRSGSRWFGTERTCVMARRDARNSEIQQNRLEASRSV